MGHQRLPDDFKTSKVSESHVKWKRDNPWNDLLRTWNWKICLLAISDFDPSGLWSNRRKRYERVWRSQFKLNTSCATGGRGRKGKKVITCHPWRIKFEREKKNFFVPPRCLSQDGGHTRTRSVSPQRCSRPAEKNGCDSVEVSLD